MPHRPEACVTIPPMPTVPLLVIAALIVALKAWHGWRIGVVRQAIGLGALAVAAFAGIVGGPIVEPMIEPLLAVPDEARAPIAGIVLGVLVDLVITLFSAVLFKKTEQQTIGAIRLVYGLAGAVLGAVYGVVLAGAIGVALLAATGQRDVLDHLSNGDFQKALDPASDHPVRKEAPRRRH